MDTAAAAARWADTWKRAWEALDPDAIVALYAEDTVVSTEPFREPARGRDAGVRGYVSRVFGEERDPRVWIGTPIVDGDRAAISWWASLIEDGADATLAGTSVLRFDGAGFVVSQWDAWNALDVRRDPPPEAELT
jgi:ketosteroid isomerase-like protein